MIVKKRVIAYQKSGEPIFGFTLPKEVNIILQRIDFFNITTSGNSILLTSGNNPRYTKEELSTYNFEDCKI
jgi:hypothetical protein